MSDRSGPRRPWSDIREPGHLASQPECNRSDCQMPKIRFHKLAAILVLIGFAGWTATGEFSSVGSAAPAATDKTEEAATPAAPVRTVAVVTPPRVMHARAIRLSGQTEADKRAVLATRVAGVIGSLPVSQGDRVKAGDIVMTLDAEEKTAAVGDGQAGARPARGRVEGHGAAGQERQHAEAAGSTRPARRWPPHGRCSRRRRPNSTATRSRRPSTALVDRVTVELGSAVMQGARDRHHPRSRSDRRPRRGQRARPRPPQDRRQGRGAAGRRQDRRGRDPLHQPRRLRRRRAPSASRSRSPTPRARCRPA